MSLRGSLILEHSKVVRNCSVPVRWTDGVIVLRYHIFHPDKINNIALIWTSICPRNG